MDQATRIIDALVAFAERADAFRHGHEELFAAVSLTEIHCIHWIGSLDHANVTKIAGKMGMTRGGICKISKKLLQRQWIESYREPSNNKELYFRLTDQGRTLFTAHAQSHARVRQERLALLQDYGPAQQATLLRFLTDINRLVDRHLAGEASADA